MPAASANSKILFVDLGNTTRRLASAALDNALEVFDQHGRADAANREFSQPGEGIELKALPYSPGVLRGPGGFANIEPLRGNRFKSVLVIKLADHLGHASLQRRILAAGKLDTSVITFAPSFLQADLRVNTKSQAFFLSQKTVFQAPVTASVGLHFKVQTLFVV